MRMLKVKAHQEMVNYRVENTYNFQDTYTLPNISTLKGWIYKVCNAPDKDNFYNRTVDSLEISVSGTPQGNAMNLQKFIKWKSAKSLVTTPTTVALISVIDLCIYIKGNDEILNLFKDNIYDTFSSIGRHEDTVRVDYCEFVEIEQEEFSRSNVHVTDYDTYITEEAATKADLDYGFKLKISTTYSITKGVRYFNKKFVRSLTNNTRFAKGKFMLDKTDKRIVDFIKLT